MRVSEAFKGLEPRIRPGAVIAIDNTSHPASRRLALAQASEPTLNAIGIYESLLGQATTATSLRSAGPAERPDGRLASENVGRCPLPLRR